jgi:NADH dehydrogenase
VVHLVGILKETRGNRYIDAHERTARVLVAAARQAGVRQLVCLSILGADTDADNACLQSRGRADAILLEAACDVTVLRVPMVLGEGDYAARALAGRAHRGINFSLRAASLEQPIYAGDVIAAIEALLRGAVPESGVLELAGPESLSRRALIERAAARLGRRTRVVSLPLAPGMALAGLLERVSASPPVTRAMLGVLDHDDRMDSAPVAARLGITLTPLDGALDRVLDSSG